MNIFDLEAGAKVVTYNRFADNRGWFSETWSTKWANELGFTKPFIQSNIVWTENKNTIRGLHAQSVPAEVAKFIQVIKGSILDVFVDARYDSETFGKWYSYELKDSIPQVLYIPRGFYHGYMSLTDDVIVQYQQDEYFTPDNEHGLLWNDAELAIDWRLDGAVPIVSEKDSAQKPWAIVRKF
jgi:dTDP-4-dehydrorhamnose 3,5-epimerase